MRHLAVCAAVLAAVLLTTPAESHACSRDDSVFFETFIDVTCLEQPLTNTTFDALGGLRLTTNGTPTATIWDSHTDFDSGVTYDSVTYPPVGVRTLVRNGTGSAAMLGLPSTLLPLTRAPSGVVLGPTASTALDNDNVDDPAVVKVGPTYAMWYSGTPDDGGGPAIFMATSTDGATWTRANSGGPVLHGTPSSFDANGAFAPDVVYDAGDLVTPYRMWYSGRAGAFGAIGYATSTDGVTWVKRGSPGLPVPVLEHGPAGSADSFSASDPTVLKDGSTWKMWYTGDDSSKKRVAYATSTDGVTWAKGGKVIAPEDPGVSANLEFGAFAPTVWKMATGYSMLLTGRKLVGGGVFQTKIMNSSSTDGVSWSGPSPALNPSGSNTHFDYSNLNSPELLEDPGAPTPYKLYYSGNTLDANDNFHTRIGLATSNDGNSFNKVNGSQTGDAVLDVGALGSAFDGRQASGLSVAAPAGATPKFVGFYWGTRGSDFKPRLGETTSSDGTTWTKVPVSAPNGGALFALGNPASFDNGGQRDPHVLADSATFHLYFTGLDASGTRSIGYASTPEVVATKLPDNASWSARSQLLDGDGSGFDADGVAHPSVIKDGATYVMYYAGSDGNGNWKIGRATAASGNGPFTAGTTAVLDVGVAGDFDAADVKDPVVVKVGAGDYRMLYTGVETLGGETVERVGYATSVDGVTWTKRGVVLGPSLTAYGFDEAGVEPAGMLVDGATLHVWTSGVDRTGRTRGGHATTPYPTPVSPQPGVPSGWATYQLGGPSTTNRDFRQIVRTSTGGSVTLWVSFLQPYSSNSNEFWSDYFPVTGASPAEALNFLLTVRAIRWQARLSGPGGSPALDKVEVQHAPVSFSPSGSAVSTSIGPSPGRTVTAWRTLTATMEVFSPGGGGSASANARLVDTATGEQVASTAIAAGQTTLDLAGVNAAAHQSLRVILELQSADGQATPRIGSFKVTFDSIATPPAPPAPPTLTMVVAPKTIVFGATATLSGKLTRSGAPLAGQVVTLAARPLGAAAFKTLPSSTTDAAGSFRRVVKPTKRTTYRASFAGATSTPTAVVAVKHRITLRSVRRSGKLYLRGTVGPRHARRVVVIQKRGGTRWVTIARVRTTRRSTFQLVRTASTTRSPYRARIAADREHLANISRFVRG
jgi:predicted GH43/DUF377 family glycosyl hydrolase